jgi:hypothetical protein
MSPFLLLAVGCAYNEHLPEVDIHGTVRIPKEAASVTLQTGEVISDPRLIGPVVLGAYPSVRDDLFSYPHPEMGPVIDEGIPGNTYPYGGGTVGRFDFACYEALACEIVTGRFKDYADVIDFHQNVLGEALIDDQGQIVETPGFYQQSCYDLLEITSDYEMSWISGEEGLHFEDAGDYYEADFDLWQVEYREGMQIWGWLDRPSVLPGTGLQYSTCDKDQGQTNNEYTNDYAYGTAQNDLLNFPGTYIAADDYVASMDQVWTATEPDSDAFRESGEDVVLDIDFLYEGY